MNHRPRSCLRCSFTELLPLGGVAPTLAPRAVVYVFPTRLQKSFHERQPRGRLSDRATVVCRRDADSHGLVCPRALVLDDELVGQALLAQSFRDLAESVLRRDRESHHDGAFGERSACRFTCGVGGLCNLNAVRQVRSHDDVVHQRCRSLLDGGGRSGGDVDRRSRRTLTVNPGCASGSTLGIAPRGVKGSKNDPRNRHKDR